jgi:hypothetical protein
VLAELLCRAAEALDNLAKPGDAVVSGAFDGFDRPVGVQQEMTARADVGDVLVASPAS